MRLELAAEIEKQIEEAANMGEPPSFALERHQADWLVAYLRRAVPEAPFIEVGELVDVADGLGTCMAEWNEDIRQTLPAGTKFYVRRGDKS